jgi:hypothetical protein
MPHLRNFVYFFIYSFSVYLTTLSTTQIIELRIIGSPAAKGAGIVPT